MPPRWLKIAQRWPKILPRCPKIAPRWAKREPRCPKMEPRSAKIAPRWRQDGAKRAPRRGCPRGRRPMLGPTWVTFAGSNTLSIDLNRFAPTAIQRFSASEGASPYRKAQKFSEAKKQKEVQIKFKNLPEKNEIAYFFILPRRCQKLPQN